jgi:hypothetical protein
MKLLRLITKAKSDEWPGGEAWRVKKALMAKYRPDDVPTVSELNKRLNAVALKVNQDPSDMFEELAAIEHAYLETKATLGSHDFIGAVSAAAPEKYHSVLTITAELKGGNLDIDHLESAMYKLWRQGGGKPIGNEDNNEIVLSAFAGTCYLCKSQGHKAADCPKKNKSGGGGAEVAAEAVAAVATRVEASSWDLATSVANSVTGKGIAGKSNRTGTRALKDTDQPNRPM